MSGLFDFVKTIGKNLFGHGDDPAAKIKEMIEKDNPGLKDVAVAFKDGVVSLAGVSFIRATSLVSASRYIGGQSPSASADPSRDGQKRTVTLAYLVNSEGQVVTRSDARHQFSKVCRHG